MIEQKIEELTAAIKENTAVVRASNSNRAAPAAKKATTTKKPPAKKEDPKPDPAAETETETPNLSLDDARDALIEVSEKCGRDTALEILGKFIPKGAAVKIGSVKEGDYAAFVVECLSTARKAEAA